MITFDHVTKRYPDGTVAVDDLTLSCETGRITVLVGSSGSGKTTSLRMINRMVVPSSGVVAIDGRDVTAGPAAALRRGIGYVIQQSGLFPHRTVVDNVATVPVLTGMRRREARARALEVLERVGLPENLARRYPFQLSGGQQQRVGVARALAADPPILLMDEPFSAVDPVVRAELQRELIRLQGELGKTVVFVTHDVDEAVKVGDRIAVLRSGGHLVQVASPEHLLARPADTFVESFVGVDRGIRRLSFFDSTHLPVDPTSVVASGEQPAEPAGHDWFLVVDAGRRPIGWLPAADLADGRATERGLRPLGHTFRAPGDSLRAVLDATVLSPSGLAAAVDGDGRAIGVVSHEDVVAEIRRANNEPGHDADWSAPAAPKKPVQA